MTEETNSPEQDNLPIRSHEAVSPGAIELTADLPAAGPLSLTAEQRGRVEEIKRAVEVTDTQGVLQYGLSAQSKIAAFADQLLGDLRARDAQSARVALSSLLARIREMDVEGMARASSSSRLPILGRFRDGLKRFENRYEKLSGSIEHLLQGLERTRIGLLKDITVLDKLYELNLEHLHDLDLYIAAGDELVEELRTRRLPEYEAEAASSGDALAGQRLADFRQAVTRFERRLHDLKLTRMIAIQSAPQIRLIQGNDQSLVEKIQTSINNTVPLWKNQIAIAVSLYRQQQALALQSEVTDASNELLSRNAEMLKTGSAKVAREAERGMVDIETLRKTNEDLIATIEETLRIQEEGRTARLQAEGELLKMQGDLRRRLTELKS
jgi:uncharacterized protein YaaN involved in tellurite resistance